MAGPRMQSQGNRCNTMSRKACKKRTSFKKTKVRKSKHIPLGKKSYVIKTVQRYKYPSSIIKEIAKVVNEISLRSPRSYLNDYPIGPPVTVIIQFDFFNKFYGYDEINFIWLLLNCTLDDLKVLITHRKYITYKFGVDIYKAALIESVKYRYRKDFYDRTEN